MLKVLIGHRGSGKSKLAERLKSYFADFEHPPVIIDLDQQIEAYEKRVIPEIFKSEGESSFRQLEVKYFNKCFESLKGPTIMVVGAGFQLENLPKDIDILWVQRDTDALGRIFVDRPRLNPELSPLEEFARRFDSREPNYFSKCTEEYILPEGLKDNCEIEKSLFTNSINDLGGILTIFPHNISKLDSFGKSWLKKRLDWGVKAFEVRDDLLTLEQRQWVFEHVPHNRILRSYRALNSLQLIKDERLYSFGLRDWALELGPPPEETELQIVSMHGILEGELSLELEALSKYEERGFQIKFAPEISSFSELQFCHLWQQENPTTRSFLPRSSPNSEVQAKWSWYRLLMKNKMPLNYIREGRLGPLDQPNLHAWIREPKHLNTGSEKKFGAVLGTPIQHSFTPIEHFHFFNNRGMAVYTIDVNSEEFFEAIQVLNQFGLTAAAVTSPLKVDAFELCDHLSTSAMQFRSVNTMVLVDSQWSGDNTDFSGLESLLKQEAPDTVAVWGGGGTLSLIQNLLPSARFYSSRTGHLRTQLQLPEADEVVVIPDFESEPFNPEAVVWAAPRIHLDLIPKTWRPRIVFDLNYREDSGGREFALRVQAKYISGERMFYIQADGQRRFWSQYL